QRQDPVHAQACTERTIRQTVAADPSPVRSPPEGDPGRLSAPPAMLPKGPRSRSSGEADRRSPCTLLAHRLREENRAASERRLAHLSIVARCLEPGADSAYMIGRRNRRGIECQQDRRLSCMFVPEQ